MRQYKTLRSTIISKYPLRNIHKCSINQNMCAGHARTFSGSVRKKFHNKVSKFSYTNTLGGSNCPRITLDHTTLYISILFPTSGGVGRITLHPHCIEFVFLCIPVSFLKLIFQKKLQSSPGRHVLQSRSIVQ